MLLVAAPQRSGCAHHLYVGLVQLLQRFRSCKYCITEVNFFLTCVIKGMLCLDTE